MLEQQTACDFTESGPNGLAHAGNNPRSQPNDNALKYAVLSSGLPPRSPPSGPTTSSTHLPRPERLLSQLPMVAMSDLENVVNIFSETSYFYWKDQNEDQPSSLQDELLSADKENRLLMASNSPVPTCQRSKSRTRSDACDTV